MKAWRTTISDDTKNSALARDCSNAKRYCEISLGLSTPKFFLVCYMLVHVEIGRTVRWGTHIFLVHGGDGREVDCKH